MSTPRRPSPTHDDAGTSHEQPVRRRPTRRRRARPVPAADRVDVLVASEGRHITDDVLDLAEKLARAGNGRVRVLTVARLYGTSFGLPNPGLRPSRPELAEQEENLGRAVDRLERHGVEASGNLVITRNPGTSIMREAKQFRCSTIVMGADARRNWLIRSMMWSQEPHRVHRRSPLPVHLVDAPPATGRRQPPARRTSASAGLRPS